MEYAIILVKKITVMLIYVLIGFVLYRKKLISQKESRAFGTLLVYAISPCIALRSFSIDFSMERLKEFIIVFFICFFIIMCWIFINRLIFRNDPLSQYVNSFPNSGFMGIPLIEASLGSAMTFYGAPFQMLTGSLQFIYSAILFQKERHFGKLLIRTPTFITIVIGFVMFVSGLGGNLPDIIAQSINGIASLSNIAMILIGIYLAQVDFKKLRLSKVMLSCMVKLVILPILSILFLKLLPISREMQLAIAISNCCPIASSGPVYAERYDMDYTYACALVTISTIMSVITIPLLIMTI